MIGQCIECGEEHFVRKQLRGQNSLHRAAGSLLARDDETRIAHAQRPEDAPLEDDAEWCLCGFDAEGKLTALTTVPGGHAVAERPDDMTFESGGQGLWSTLDDYLAFARIFPGRGEVDGVRLLRRETGAMMASNQLTSDQRRTARMFGMPLFAAGHGYGMGVAVVMEPDKADPLRCRGGVGTVGWPGAYGGWWQADQSDNSVLIFLTHNMVELQQMASGIGLDAWSATAKFHELASGLREPTRSVVAG